MHSGASRLDSASLLPFSPGGPSFRVGRIFCVGRNYASHAREMGGDSGHTPFFFIKPADNLLPCGGDLPYPSLTENLHHEVELAMALAADEDGRIRPVGYAVALDLTRRDLQNTAKKRGQPWAAGKCFPGAAPCGALSSATDFRLENQRIELFVNDLPRQRGHLGDMLWKPTEIVQHVEDLFQLRSGDLIFTGTPEGVGPLLPGDRVRARVDGLSELCLRILPRSGAQGSCIRV